MMCIHSLLLFFFFIAQFTAADDRSVCNSQSIHQCICVANKNNSTVDPLCTDLIIIDHSIDTLQIEFYNYNRCSSFDEHDQFRRKLAEWISQECSSALLDCRYRLTIDNVLIIGINCSTTSQFSYLNLVVTISTIDRQLAPNHLLDARIIGEVVQTRQHLMPLLIGADLHSITIERIYSTAQVTTVVWWNDTAMAILVFYIAIVSSIICIKCCYHPRKCTRIKYTLAPTTGIPINRSNMTADESFIDDHPAATEQPSAIIFDKQLVIDRVENISSISDYDNV